MRPKLQNTRKKARQILIGVLGLGLIATAGACAADSDTPSAGGRASVKLSYASSSPIATLLAAQERKTWATHDIDVAYEGVSDVGLSTNLLIGKQVQFAHSAPTTVFSAVAKGVPVTILAGIGFGQGDNQAGFLAAPASSGIKTLADLKGKKVAITGLGTSYDFYIRAQLAKAGLVGGKDVQLLAVPSPQMRGALSTKQVDAALLLAVDYARMSAAEPVNVLATTGELAGSPIEHTACIIVRTDWLADHKAETVNFLAGLLEGQSWMQKDIASNNGAEVRKLLQPALKYDNATMDQYYRYRLADIGQEPKFLNLLGVSKGFVDNAVNTLKAGGGLEGTKQVTFENAVDLSYLKEAYKVAGLTWNDSPTYP